MVYLMTLKSKDFKQYVGRTTDTDEYSFYGPDRHVEHTNQDTGNYIGITAKYDTAVNFGCLQ